MKSLFTKNAFKDSIFNMSWRTIYCTTSIQPQPHPTSPQLNLNLAQPHPNQILILTFLLGVSYITPIQPQPQPHSYPNSTITLTFWLRGSHYALSIVSCQVSIYLLQNKLKNVYVDSSNTNTKV